MRRQGRISRGTSDTHVRGSLQKLVPTQSYNAGVELSGRTNFAGNVCTCKRCITLSSLDCYRAKDAHWHLDLCESCRVGSLFIAVLGVLSSDIDKRAKA